MKQNRSALLEDRDTILLEQRGNRFAEPALMGSELDRGASVFSAFRDGKKRRITVVSALFNLAYKISLLFVLKYRFDLLGFPARQIPSIFIRITRSGVNSFFPFKSPRQYSM